MPTNTGGKSIVILGAVFIPLDILAVALRLWARRIRKTSWKLCDYLIIVALVRKLLQIFRRLLVLTDIYRRLTLPTLQSESNVGLLHLVP